MNYPGTSILPHPELASGLSERDAAALEMIPDVSEVRAWTQRKMAKYKKYTSTLQAIHNSISPINELPTEILQKIFAYVPPKYGGWYDLVRMVSLQSVCRRWRSVLLVTPEYWVQGIPYIMEVYDDGLFLGSNSDDSDDSDDSEDDAGASVLALFLTRSAPCPLELELGYTSSDDCPGWQVFEDHFDRVSVFEVTPKGYADLDHILHAATTGMKRLERFDLGEVDFKTSMDGIDQWEARDLPRLGCLSIPGSLFCCATTVPSLHTVVLTGERDIGSLSDLLAALERCPALATLCLQFTSTHRSGNTHRRTPDRAVDLRNLRQLDVTGDTHDIYCFLSSLSFPSVTQIKLCVTNAGDEELVLPNTIPRRHSSLYVSPNINRLCLYSGSWRRYDWEPESVWMRGYVQGEERLQVNPALRLHSADRLLQFLDSFSACTLTELALDLRRLPSVMDCTSWQRFFAALPDLRRLELLSSSTESRAMKRTIAEEFLAALRDTRRAEARGEACLAWVLCAETSGTTRRELEEELRDVEQVLSSHADAGGRLGQLELYVTASQSRCYSPSVFDVTQVTTDDAASRLVTRAYISRLEDVADVVFVGGEWEFAEDDEHDLDDGANEDACAGTAGEGDDAVGALLI